MGAQASGATSNSGRRIATRPSASIRAAVRALPGSGRRIATARGHPANNARIAGGGAFEQIRGKRRGDVFAGRAVAPAIDADRTILGIERGAHL